jgi:hypothetical protein
VFRQVSEAQGVGLATATGAQNAVVAGQFALRAKAAFDPEEHRVDGEQNQADFLQEVGPVVGAAQVLHLVDYHLLQF